MSVQSVDSFTARGTGDNAQHEPTITGLENGDFAVAWQDSQDSLVIQGEVFTSGGASTGSFTARGTGDNNQWDPMITGLENGHFAIAWVNQQDPEVVQGEVFTSGGASTGTFTARGTGDNIQLEPTITGLANGNFAVAWTDRPYFNVVQGEVFTSGGASTGSFTVRGAGESDQEKPTITGLENGHFAVAWEWEDDQNLEVVQGEVFTSGGASTGTFTARGTGDDSQYDPTITDLANGNFAVAWTDDQDPQVVQGEVFTGGGASTGTFTARGTGDDSQYDPTITGLKNGQFAVAWEDDAPSNPVVIQGEVFTSGGASTGTFTARGTGDDSQHEPTITGLENGDFAVAWQDRHWPNVIQGEVFTSSGTNTAPSANYTIAPADADKLEGDTGSKAFTFDVNRSGDVGSSATVDWSVSGSGADPADAADFWVGTSSDNQTTNAETTIPTTDQDLGVSLTAPDAASASSISLSGRIDRGGGSEQTVNVAYVVDTSGSMSDSSSDLQVGDLNGDGDNNTLLDGTIAGFENLNQSLIQDGFQDAQIGVIPFADSATVAETAAAGAASSGDGRTDVSEALRGLNADGGTNYEAALQEANSFFSSVGSGTNYVFFISDGENREGGTYTDEVEALRDDHGADIRAIPLTSSANLDDLDRVDDGQSNDSVSLVTQPSDLSADLQRSSVPKAEIDQVEILHDGSVVETIDGDDLTSTALGLKYTATIDGLRSDAADQIGVRVTATDADGTQVTTQQTVEESGEETGLPSGSLNFDAGETEQTLTVSVLGDTDEEPDEGFSVELTRPSDGTDQGSASGTIRNDDAEDDTFAGFTTTDNEYEVNEDYENIIDETYGEDAELAAWDDVVETYQEHGPAFLRGVGLVQDGSNGNGGAAVTRDGDRFWMGDRQYFASFGPVADSFLSHDSVTVDGVPLHLGSWDSDKLLFVDLGSNQPPEARDDTLTLDSGSIETIDVLDNDPDGDTLTILDPGDPDHGETEITDDGEIRYTPDNGFTGADSFTYTVADGNGETASAAVEVDVTAGGSSPSTPEQGTELIKLY